MRPVNSQVLAAVDGSVNQTAIVPSGFNVAISAQAIATGAMTGTMKLQASNDPASYQNPVHWNDITGATVAVTAAGTFLIPKTELSYRWVQVVFTATGGAGTITVNIQGWGI